MNNTFFTNPLWRKFHNRPIWVLSLSDLEHRLRDALALIALRDFLPPETSGRCTYSRVTLGDHGLPVSAWPDMPADAGIVVLGRPALFGPELMHQVDKYWTPSLGFRFVSDNRRDGDRYRTIEALGTGEVILTPHWSEQKPIHNEIFDHGIVFSGWAQNRPVVLLSGTSTIGTWGCVKFVTEPPPPFDLRWEEDVQGLVRAFVDNVSGSYRDVRVAPVKDHFLAPCRIWMEGKDLPALRGWRDVSRLRLEEAAAAAKFDLHITINDKAIFEKCRTHIDALVLLALASSKREERVFPGGTQVRSSPAEILHSIFNFVHPKQAGGASPMSYEDFRDRYRTHVQQILKDLVKQARHNGGIADVTPHDKGRFGICTRPLPPFLPAISE